MRILYDYQIFIYQNWGGISRYFSEIIKRFPSDFIPTVGIKTSSNLFADSFPNVARPGGLFSDAFPFPACIKRSRIYNTLKVFWLRSLNKKFYKALLLQKEYDLVHITLDFEDWWLPCLGTTPFVYTVHDLIPEFFWNNPVYLQKRKTLAAKAARVIAVSENTKRDCVRLFGIPEEKVDVIYHAPSVQESGGRQVNPAGDYLLYVGTRNRQKNFIWFVTALAPLLKGRCDLKLMCTGNDFSKEERTLLERLGVVRQVTARFFDEDEMFDLYRHARAFIYPSRYEGFGLPILDAFKAGCPVLLANGSCFPEVGADAARYFILDDADSLLTQVIDLIDNPVLRKTLIEKGRERVKLFSWDDAARKTADVYRCAIKGY